MLLYLAGNNKLVTEVRLNDDDVRLLCETLKNNTYVTSLDLRYNNITDDGAQHVAKLIQETPTLKEVNLMCNDFGEDGAEAIAEALQVGSLRTVHLCDEFFQKSEIEWHCQGNNRSS